MSFGFDLRCIRKARTLSPCDGPCGRQSIFPCFTHRGTHRHGKAKHSTAQKRWLAKGEKWARACIKHTAVRQYSSTVVDWVPISHIRFDIRWWRLIKYIININNCDVWNALNVYSGALVSCLNWKIKKNRHSEIDWISSAIIGFGERVCVCVRVNTTDTNWPPDHWLP